jgi:putative ABC transport system permease protein
VGVVTGPSVLGKPQLVARPGTLVPASGGSRGWFVDGPVSWEQVRAFNALGASVVSRAVLADPPPIPPELVEAGAYVDPTVAGIVGVAAVLVLLQITLLAGPALAVGARRNQRSLAVVASAGGSPSALRRAVLASGLVTGFATSVVAAGLGIGVVAVARGRLESLASAPLPRIDVHVLDLLAVVAVGTGTALAAALVPAIQAGRQDVVSALMGRRGQPAPRRRVAVSGLVLVGAGLLTALLAAAQHSPFLVSVGLALGEFGLVALSGTLVVLAAKVAPRLPLASRLALRDAARQRGRTAPAVAAVLAVVAGCSAVALYVASREQYEQARYIPQAAPGVVVVGTAAARAAAAEADVRATMPVDRVVRLNELVTNAAGVSPDTRDVAPSPRTRFVQPRGQVFVDDGSGVAVLTGDDNPAVRQALAAGRVVVFSPQMLFPDGTVHLRVSHGDDAPVVDVNGNELPGGTVVKLPGTFVELPLATPQPVLPASLVPRLGLGKDASVQPTLVVASTTRTPTSAEEQRLQARTIEGDANVERGYRSPYPVFLLVIAIASIVVALGSTLAVVGLSAAEGRADVSTLAAVGAPPRVRRRLAAAQAGVVAVLGTLLGCVSGVVSGATLVLLSRRVGGYERPDGGWVPDWQVVVPWRDLGVLGLALPLLAVLAAMALTRSRLPMVRRLGQ